MVFNSIEILKFLKEQNIKFGYQYPGGTFFKEPLKAGNRNIKKLRAKYN